MAQECDFSLNTPCSGKSGQLAACPHDAMAGNDDRDRIATASAANGLGRNTKSFGDIAIGDGVSERDLEHLITDSALKIAAMDTQRQVKGGQITCKIGRQLRDGFIYNIGMTLRRTAPIKSRDFTVFFFDGKTPNWAVKTLHRHGSTVSNGCRKGNPRGPAPLWGRAARNS